MRDRVPLGAVAAALASSETAERIAVLEAATSGGLSALDAARLNSRRAGHDLALLDGLNGLSDRREGSADAASPLPYPSDLANLASLSNLGWHIDSGGCGAGAGGAVVTVALADTAP
jgi:hypothetical protein